MLVNGDSAEVEENEDSLRSFADMVKGLTKGRGIRMERKERLENYAGGYGVTIQTSGPVGCEIKERELPRSPRFLAWVLSPADMGEKRGCMRQ